MHIHRVRAVCAAVVIMFATAPRDVAAQAAGSNAAAVVQADAQVRAGKYADAKNTVEAYLKDHPNDGDAQAVLGVADAYLNDSAGAVAAFDAAGTIPQQYRAVAAKAYSDAAVDALKAKNNDRAIALSDKALALQQNVNTLFVRGTAYANAQRYDAAIADLTKAKAQATAGHADAATFNAIDASLATSYLFGGQPDKGLALARGVKQRDPANTRVDDAVASYYNQQAVAAMRAGNTALAVTELESGAAAAPARAVKLYVQAANVLAQATPPDWKRVKAEADKALAIDRNDARANYVAGVASANGGDRAAAVPFLQRAKTYAGPDAALNAEIDAALSKLGAQSTGQK